jgi:hypothetical protein
LIIIIIDNNNKNNNNCFIVIDIYIIIITGINSSRIIYGHVLAEEVFIPRIPHCSYALSNPLEIRVVAEKLINLSRQYLNISHSKNNKKIHKYNSSKEINIVIIQRYINETFYFGNNTFPYVSSFKFNEKVYDSSKF